MTDLPSPVLRPDRPQATGRLWSRPTRTRLYASDSTHARARRATDVLLLSFCIAGLVLVVQLSSPPSALERALIDVAAAIPAFLDVVWLVAVGLLTAWGLLLVAASLVRGRLEVLRDQLLGVVFAAALVAAIQEIVSDTTALWSSVTSTGPPSDSVSARIALAAAVTVVASPHIARPFRAVSRWLVATGALSLVILEATTPSGAVLGVLCGAAAGAAVHLLLGSSGGRPGFDEVRRGLEELGIEVASLSEGERQRAGVYVLDAIDPSARALVVKVYGRDAWDTQLLAKAWRALWYRDVGTLTLTRVQQAEHEAFVTLLAARNGVSVHDVVGAGRTTDGDAMIVLRMRGAPLDESVDATTVERAWDSVLTLGLAGFAHGDLAPSVFHVDGDDVVVDGLGGVVVAPTEDQRRVDLAQLLVTSALLAGPAEAVAIASRRLGAVGLAEVLPYLQPAALGPQLRSAVADADPELDLDDLRTMAAAAAGVDEPRLAKLRRVSTGTVVQAGLMALAAYFFISLLAGIDMAELADALSDASLAILVVALLWGQVPRFAQAESTRSACPRPLPYGPVALLQFAITFVNLAIPSTAARVAVSIRFFQRQGIPPASAVSIGVVDSVCGFAVQVLILVAVAVFGFGNVNLDIDRPSNLENGDLLRVFVTILVIAIVVALVAAAIPRTRRWALERIRPWFHEALETLSTLRSPSRVARVLGANLAAETLFATTLGIVLAAFGTSLPLATLLVVNVSVALFSGLMPVPGGIGVTEGALVVMLTAAGVGEAVAFGAAIAYRICTFYLPPIWGAAAFRRLERNGYL